MIEESARVVGVAPGLAWVETSRRAACGACAASQGCGTSVVSKLFAARSNRLQVSDAIGVEIGDQVVIGIADSTLTRASMLAYLLPLVTLILATYTAELAGAGEAFGAMAGILGLCLGIWITGRLTNVAAWSERNRPVLLRKSETPALVTPPTPARADPRF